MAHYRKIDTRILLDQKFNQLSTQARLVFLHLLIHPNLTSLGAMHASLSSLACELNWLVDQVQETIDVLAQKGMVRYDEQARFVWLPNFLKYNTPESPNVIKSWETAFSYLPECTLQKQLILHVQQFVATLPMAFQDALPACFHEVVASTVIPLDVIPQATCNAENATPETLSEGSLKTPSPLSESISENDLPLSKRFQ